MTQNTLTWNFIVKGTDKAGKQLKSAADHMGGIGKAAALAGAGAAAGLGILGIAVGKGIKDAIAYQTLQKKTEAVLKSTGNTAHTSVKGIQQLAAQYENMSGVDETLIINSQNVLASFTKVQNRVGKGNDIFNKATLAALNMSTALGKDLQGSTVLVGKALQDPVKGMSALTRVGIRFSDAQQKVIKHMVATGHTADAQKLILAELEKRFGGAAKAAGSGFAGQMARAKDAISDAFRTIGLQLLPVFAKMVAWFAKILPKVTEFAAGFGPKLHIAILLISQSFKEILSVGKNLLAFYKQHQTLINSLIIAFGTIKVALIAYNIYQKIVVLGVQAWAKAQVILNAILDANPIGVITLAIIGLVAGLIYAYKHSETFRKIVQRAFHDVGQVFIWFKNIAVDVFNWVKKNWPLMLAIITGPIGLATLFIHRHWDEIKTTFRNGVNDVKNYFHDLPGKIVAAVGNLGSLLLQKGKDILTGLWNGIKSVWTNVTSWFKDIPGKILHALGFGSPPKWAIDAGKQVMESFLKGLKSKAGNAFNFLKGLTGALFGGKGGGNRANQRIGQQMAMAYGWTGSQWNALRTLWMNESGWSNTARNPSSGAFGIPQALPPGKMGAQAVAGNAAAQIAWGLNYIKSVYGSPMAALAMWESRHPHWYDTGGLLTEPVFGYGRYSGKAYGFAGHGPEWITPASQANGDTYITVKIGETELRGIVSTEVSKGIGVATRGVNARRSEF